MAATAGEDFFTGAKRFGACLAGVHPAVLLVVAHRLGIFKALGGRRLSAAEISGLLRTHPPYTETVLDGLVAIDFLVKQDGTYANIPFVTECLLTEGPESMGVYLDFLLAQWNLLPQLEEVVRSGRPVADLDIFNEHAALGVVGIEVANHHLHFAAGELLARLDLSGVRRAILGSAGVSFAKALTDLRPDVQLTFTCLPHCIREVPRLAAFYGLPRESIVEMEAHVGDPEQDRWGAEERHDLVLLTRKMAMAPFADFGRKFLEKSFAVLEPGGFVVLWEPLLDEGRTAPRAAALAAVFDLYGCRGGRVYEEAELRSLVAGAGFERVERFDCAGGRTTFLVGRK